MAQVREDPPERRAAAKKRTSGKDVSTALDTLQGRCATVDSAGVLLGVVLDYMRREREMQEGGIAVRERLLVRLRLFRKPNCVICCTFVSTKTVKNSL